LIFGVVFNLSSFFFFSLKILKIKRWIK